MQKISCSNAEDYNTRVGHSRRNLRPRIITIRASLEQISSHNGDTSTRSIKGEIFLSLLANLSSWPARRLSGGAPNKVVNTICLAAPEALAAEKSSTFSDDLFAGPSQAGGFVCAKHGTLQASSFSGGRHQR